MTQNFLWRAVVVVSVMAFPFRTEAQTQVQLFVAPTGSDTNTGTLANPVASFARAQALARAARKKGASVAVNFRAGTYYLPKTVVFTAQDSGTKAAPVVYQAYGKELPVISGGAKVHLQWQPYKDGIWQAKVPEGFTSDQLFVNGQSQRMARYPNFDPNQRIFGGFAKDAVSRERAARWADPTGGYLHALHQALWGGYSFRITGKDAAGDVTMEGGWQNNRGGPPHDTQRYVENIFEELDAPGEWYLNTKASTLYFYPPANVNIKQANVEAVRLRHLIEFRGSETQPVKFMSLRGLTFRHTAHTFMENKEPLLRSDWTTYRGGAIFFNGAEDCALEDSFLDQVGGNAIFVSNYNRRIAVRGCRIDKAGANGVAFIGDPNAVRNPLFNYGQVQPLAQIDRTPGPKTNNFPADCIVEDSLITQTGSVEKQTAGVTMDMAQGITVRHCSIYDVPRAGINIGDGAWGGHVIEGCDVFDTVKETGDHGSFNSWGRDRFWRPDIAEVNAVVKEAPEAPFLDVVKPIIIRNSRWRCDHGWDIDLDDGSSNYIITNNLCLNGGLKNREGYKRTVENNIIVNNSLNAHVWYQNSGDIFRRNIVGTPYLPIGMPSEPWGQQFSSNFLHSAGTPTTPATELQAQSKRDASSLKGDALFRDAARGDYRVQDSSPALALGFKNFPMNGFGVQKPSLKAIARTPQMPGTSQVLAASRDTTLFSWNGAQIRNIANEGEMSAFGVAGVSGVLVLDVPTQSALAKAGLRKNDVIVSFGSQRIVSVSDLKAQAATMKVGQTPKIGISRNQKGSILTLLVDADTIPTFVPANAPTIVQEASGRLRLNARDTEVVGATAIKQGDEINIGYWKDAADFVRWPVQIVKPGTFQVELTYACEPGSDGSEFTLAVSGRTLSGKVMATQSWNDYRVFQLGELRVDKPGIVMLTLRPTKKPGLAVMNLRAVELKPLAE